MADQDPEKDAQQQVPNDQNPSRTINFAHEFTRAGQIRRPSGRLVHIASSPAEVPLLQRKLSTVVTPPEEFEIVVQGSAEHINALRETHTHHEQLREELRAKYGDEFEQFEKVVRDLDHLGNELHNVSHHAVNLDANFDKYGYSATIREFERRVKGELANGC
jgi:hypothetical protein